MPQFLIELKKSGNEVLHIILFVIRDDCGDSVEISEDLANLLVNRLVEPQPSGKVCCQVVTDPCLKLFAIIDYASNNTARPSCHSSAETANMKYQERLHINAKGDRFSSLLQTASWIGPLFAVHCPSYNYVKRAQIKINILYGQCIYCFLLYIIAVHCSHILYCTSRFFHYKPFSSCCRSRFFHYELFRPSKTSIVTLQWYNGGHTTITYNKIQ